MLKCEPTATGCCWVLTRVKLDVRGVVQVCGRSTLPQETPRRSRSVATGRGRAHSYLHPASASLLYSARSRPRRAPLTACLSRHGSHLSTALNLCSQSMHTGPERTQCLLLEPKEQGPTFACAGSLPHPPRAGSACSGPCSPAAASLYAGAAAISVTLLLSASLSAPSPRVEGPAASSHRARRRCVGR